MKNISRRNFMKGITALGTSAVATSILAGCGIHDMGVNTPETGFQPIEDSVEIDHENFKMTVNGYDYNNDSKILAVDVTAENYTDQPVTFGSAIADKGEAKVTAYADAQINLGQHSMTFVQGTTSTSLYEKTVAAKVASSAGVVNGKMLFAVDSEYKDWKAITMIVRVKVDDTDVENMEFVINR